MVHCRCCHPGALPLLATLTGLAAPPPLPPSPSARFLNCRGWWPRSRAMPPLPGTGEAWARPLPMLAVGARRSPDPCTRIMVLLSFLHAHAPAKWRSCRGSCSLRPTVCLPRRSSSSSLGRHRRRQLCSGRRCHRLSSLQRLRLRPQQRRLIWAVMMMICSAASPWPRPPSQPRSRPPAAARLQWCMHQQPLLRALGRQHRRSAAGAAQAPQANLLQPRPPWQARAACEQGQGTRAVPAVPAQGFLLLHLIHSEPPSLLLSSAGARWMKASSPACLWSPRPRRRQS